MRRRDFLSLTARTAAACAATPVVASTAVEAARHGGITPRRVTRANDFVVSAESFTEGHSDKLADLIADTITDSLQAQRIGRCHGGAIDVYASRDLIVVGGTVAGPWAPMIDCFDESYWDRFKQPIRDLLRETGQGEPDFTVDPDAIEIRFSSIVQCFDGARGVFGEPGPDESVLVYGYATDETPELMPLPTVLAHRLAQRTADARKSGVLPWLLPFGHTKVSVRYVEGEPVAVDNVEVRVQHFPDVDAKLQREAICEHVLEPILGEEIFGGETQLRINPSGNCFFDGLIMRGGVSGRRLASDTYGAHCPLPSTSLSGQGTENIQRSGTLMARCLAKHVVAAGLARRCTVHLAYAVGQPEPEAVLVDTHGTGTVPDERIEHGIRVAFPLTAWGIFEYLDLGRPIYRKAAVFGYFGREDPEFSWERIDQISALAAAV